jgi:hypothetical protein
MKCNEKEVTRERGRKRIWIRIGTYHTFIIIILNEMQYSVAEKGVRSHWIATVQ